MCFPMLDTDSGKTANGNCSPQRIDRTVRVMCTDIPACLSLTVSAAKTSRNPIRNGMIRMIENRFFDLGTCDTQRYYNRFPENDVVACNSLANDLSISKSLIFQLSIMGTLLHVDSNIHPRLYNQMAKVVIRFRKELLSWAKKAVEIENSCRKKAVSFHCEEKIPFEDAVGEHAFLDIWDSEDI